MLTPPRFGPVQGQVRGIHVVRFKIVLRISEVVFDELASDAGIAQCLNVGIHSLRDSGWPVLHRQNQLMLHVRCVLVYFLLRELSVFATHRDAPTGFAVRLTAVFITER